MVRKEDFAGSAPLANVREIAGREIDGTHSSFASPSLEAARPNNAVFQPDGKVLARFGDRLIYFVGPEPHKVGVPDDLRDVVRTSHSLARGPGGGFALVGERHVLLVKGGRMVKMPLPARSSGGEVGEIQAVLGDGRVFAIVTAETDDSNGGPEMWRSNDGVSWSAPALLPLGGDVHALADGPYGTLVVGSRRNAKARALFVGLDEQTNVYTAGVNDKPPLRACVCSAGREAWGAGDGLVLRFDKGAVAPEKVEASDAPVAMALDMVGIPWLVTERAVLRRHVGDGEGVWRAYYKRDAARPPLVGVGFTPEGARLLDARGGMVELEPRDVAGWRAAVASSR
jgi:hypothetical protein